MSVRRKPPRSGDLYDLWDGSAEKVKTHPSTKRSRSIQLPHPGQSYNPDRRDHARLLNKVAAQELAYLKKQASLKKTPETISKSNYSEIDDREDEDVDDEDDDENSYGAHENSSSKKVEEKRKTKKQRLAQLRDRLQRKEAKLRKLKNIRLSRFDNIKKIMKKLDQKAKEEEAKRMKKSRKRRKERLGSKFEPSDPVYCLSSELPSSLREVSAPMNAIVREQLESFQARLLVEPTKIQAKKRKYRKKMYERQTADERER